MSKGFIFDSGKCVSCGACSAACNLYNCWVTRPRNIYTLTRGTPSESDVLNISLSCNHCRKASCMEGCPSQALTRDALGIVLLDESKCLGCRYCLWNCPYNAPKFNRGKGVIEKCHLCYDSTDELPSCTTACPTGALKFMEIPETQYDNFPEMFPGKKLKPAFNFAAFSSEPLEIIPSGAFMQNEIEPAVKPRESEWSLIMFSFISMIAVTMQVSSFITGTFNGILFFALPVIAALLSLFHLGKPSRAWRAVFNPVSSPVSREILFFILFASLSLLATLVQSVTLSLTSAIGGIVLLIIIDSVYFKPDRKSFYHSGQVFLSALLLVAYLTGSFIPFTFIVILKVVLSAGKIREGSMQSLRFVRIAVLLIVWAGLFSGFAEASAPVTFILIAAELLDRILFYADFKPENIERVADKYIND